MTRSAKELYKDYWVGTAEERDKRLYYERLYGHLLPRITVRPDWKILDVAGGNGHLMRYLGIKKADILDISETGLQVAKETGFNPICGDIQRRFPVSEETYDAAFCFEVLEHLHYPNKTLAEINNILKPQAVLYIGQPNMRADGVYHVRRYALRELLDDLKKAGFFVEWIDYVPAYSVRDAILSDIRNNQMLMRRLVQCVNLCLSFLPWLWRYQMAKWIPDRFALLFVVKAVKNES